MKIYLSPTAIKDFMTCEKKYFYKRDYKEFEEKSVYLVIGGLVHSVVEKYWYDEEKAWEYLHKEINNNSLGEYYEKFEKSMKSLFSNFNQLLNKNDIVEYKFTYPHNTDVSIVGRIDRIVAEEYIIDWKTGYTLPKTIDTDPQALIYYEAFYRRFGKYPKDIYYIYLEQNKILKYHYNSVYSNLLNNEIIPNMLRKIKDNSFTHTGIFTTACNNCEMRKFCYGNL